MLTGLLIWAIVVLRGFPETAAARWLSRMLVATLGKASRRHVIFLILMTVILIAGAELLAMAGPLDAGLVMLWDLSAFIDAVIATATVASVARGMRGWRGIVTRLAPRRATRARRHRTSRSAKPPAHDEDRRSFAHAA